MNAASHVLCSPPSLRPTSGGHVFTQAGSSVASRMKFGFAVGLFQYSVQAHVQLSSVGHISLIAPPTHPAQQEGMSAMYWTISGWLLGGALGSGLEGKVEVRIWADTMPLRRSAAARTVTVKRFIFGRIVWDR